MKTLLLALTLGLATVGCSEARTLCMLGDSITWGTRDITGARLPMPPPAALEALLRRAPRGHAWRYAKVRNYGVPGTWTGEWIGGVPRADVCTQWSATIPFVADACARGVSLLEVLLDSGVRCDGWLIALGLNDWVPGPSVSIATSADNLAAIAARVVGPTWIGAPTHVTNALIEVRRNYLRNELVTRGMLTGIDPPLVPLGSDGIHPNDAGAAALGGLWYGVVR